MILPLWSGEFGFGTTVLLTILAIIIIGGQVAMAMATGRALALTWRPWWQCVVYAAPLALAIAFLYYALFEVSVVSIENIVDEISNSDSFAGTLGTIAWNMRYWAILFLMFSLLSLAGYRLTRVRQMTRRYRFAYAAKNMFQWRKSG